MLGVPRPWSGSRALGGLFPDSGPQAPQVVNKVFPGPNLLFFDVGGPVGPTSQ